MEASDYPLAIMEKVDTEKKKNKSLIGENDFGDLFDDMMETFMHAIMFVAVLALFLPSLIRNAESNSTFVQSRMTLGILDPREGIDVSEQIQWIDLISGHPFTPWASMDVHNLGPGSIFIGINSPENMIEIAEDQTSNFDFIGALNRISVVFFQSEGQAANIDIIGRY